MTEHQRLFLVQARSCFAVFGVLRGRRELPACHALQQLQMATELLGKAHAWKTGPNLTSHRAFVGFFRSLAASRRAQKQLGFEGQNGVWRNLIRKALPLAERVEDLAPALAGDGPNPEYPWPPSDPHTAPAEYLFDLWAELDATPPGRQFLGLIERLISSSTALCLVF